MSSPKYLERIGTLIIETTPQKRIVQRLIFVLIFFAIQTKQAKAFSNPPQIPHSPTPERSVSQKLAQANLPEYLQEKECLTFDGKVQYLPSQAQINALPPSSELKEMIKWTNQCKLYTRLAKVIYDYDNQNYGQSGNLSKREFSQLQTIFRNGQYVTKYVALYTFAGDRRRRNENAADLIERYVARKISVDLIKNYRNGENQLSDILNLDDTRKLLNRHPALRAKLQQIIQDFYVNNK